MASATTANDGGYITGSYDITLDSLPYTLDTIDHELPVAQQDANTAAGLPKGGAFVRQKEKMSVKIKAVTGVAAPSQMVPFALAVHGYSSKNWIVTNLKIASSNEAANIRTYTADLVEWIAAI
jgi:hypothetical protein